MKALKMSDWGKPWLWLDIMKASPWMMKSLWIVEASFMMMNQVDSRCFDDNKRWWQKSQENDFKIESTIQESREVWFQDSRKNEFKFQEKKSRRLHKGSIEKIFQKTNIAQFCFSKEFSQNFLSYQSFYSLVIDYQFPVIDYQCIWTLEFKFNCEESHPFIKCFV